MQEDDGFQQVYEVFGKGWQGCRLGLEPQLCTSLGYNLGQVPEFSEPGFLSSGMGLSVVTGPCDRVTTREPFPGAHGFMSRSVHLLPPSVPYLGCSS